MSSGGGGAGGLGVMLQRLRQAVYAPVRAPETPENYEGDEGAGMLGATGAGSDVEGLLAGAASSSSSGAGGGGIRSGGLLNGGWALGLLDEYGDRRRKFMARLKFMEPLVASDLPVHALALSLTLWIWGISLARAHTFTLFSFHPVFMSLACVLLMTEGVLAYRNLACFHCLSPIMKNSPRVKLQNIHRAFHVLAAAFIGMGMAFIFSTKVKKHRTLLPTSIHAALGFLVCIFIVLQVVAGIEKLDSQRSGVEGARGGSGGLYRWHGKAGLVLYDLSMLTVATGLLKSLHPSWITAGMLVHLCAVWVLVHLQILLKPLKLGLGGVNTLDSLVGERELVDLDRGGGPGERRRDSRGSIGGGQGRKESLGEVSVESI